MQLAHTKKVPKRINYEPYHDKTLKSHPFSKTFKPSTKPLKNSKATPKPPTSLPQTKPTTNPYAKPFPPKCFRCQQSSHRYNECPRDDLSM